MSDFPALLDLSDDTLYPLRDRSPFAVGRTPDADLPVLDLTCSRRQFRIVRSGNEYILEPESAKNPTSLNGQELTQPAALTHGAEIRAGNSRFRFLMEPPQESRVSRVATIAPTIMGQLSTSGTSHAAEVREAIPLTGTHTLGRDPRQVDLLLRHPHVSRAHARIELVAPDDATITDLGSANGTFLNGKRVTGRIRLDPGDRIDIGPYSLTFTGQALEPTTREDNVELVGRGLSRSVRDRTTGEPRSLLDKIDLVIRPREFVCLLGPSGSGKSTLLGALSARAPADGAVLLNGRDLYAGFEMLKRDLVVVPQRDALYETLTVGQMLNYTAALRLPPDTDAGEREEHVARMLKTVGLVPQRHTLIRHLSGGQMKRTSLANELLSGPSLLFLDEVTSGLDEQTDREMMNLFRSLADAGKTVVCITHSLANVERTCHLVVILAGGGRLAFVGTPSEALKYFDIDRLGDVYERLASRSPEEWQSRFRASEYYGRYVRERMPDSGGSLAELTMPQRGRGGVREFVRQAALLTRRAVAILRGDLAMLSAMAGQALLVAFLLILVFGDLSVPEHADNEGLKITVMIGDFALPEPPGHHARQTVTLLFLLNLSCLWFGCNAAAKALVAERVIYSRERAVCLRNDGYLLSKLVVLAGVSGLQSMVLFAIVWSYCAPPGDGLAVAMVLLGVTATGTALGLAISAASPTEDSAVSLIPMCLIPQIILADALVRLNGFAEWLGRLFTSAYWGQRALIAQIPEETAELAGHDPMAGWQALCVLGVHFGVFLLATWAVLHWRGQVLKPIRLTLLRRWQSGWGKRTST